MSRPDGPAVPASDAGERRGPPVGLLAKLMATVRPEFRAEVLVFDPQDPVFGGPPCAVAGCGWPARARGMCTGHHERWIDAGKPELAQFAATAGSRWRGRMSLQPCQVPGCLYGRSRKGLCEPHRQAWRRAGRPELEQWRATQQPAAPPGRRQTCLVPPCRLWAHQPAQLCLNHGRRWRAAGCPDIEEFTRACSDAMSPSESIDLRPLGAQLRLELQYALQCRRDEGKSRIWPSTFRRIVGFLAASGVASLLDEPEEAWKERFPDARRASHGRATLVQARQRIEDLACGHGWEIEYGRDIWRLRTLGIDAGEHPRLRFDRIPQPWLKDLAKRWLRWRLSTGLGTSHAYKSVAMITRFAAFLASPQAQVSELAHMAGPYWSTTSPTFPPSWPGRKSWASTSGS